MRSASRTLAVLALAALSAGCSVAQTVVTDPTEYGVYRRSRASKSLDDRLSASLDYLVTYPEGAYVESVRAFFQRVEPLYFERSKGSLSGLESYLKALPKGPHSREATMRLRDLRAADKAERTDLLGTALAADVHLAREVKRREAVRERISIWIGLFLDPQAFSRPMVDASASLIVPWSLALPWPNCERTDTGDPEAPKGGPPGAVRRCVKLLQLGYRATHEGEAQDRQALVDVAVWQDEPGTPIEVSIGGPDLFLRLDETFTARGAEATDPEARLRGAERAVELAQKVFASRVSGQATCKKSSDSDVLRLACNGISLRVLAGALDGDDDRFVIRPSQ